MAAFALAGLFATSLRAEEASVITKPPHLVHFVPAEYPKDKHDAGITAQVLLSIEIGDDGKVGEVEVADGHVPGHVGRRRGG